MNRIAALAGGRRLLGPGMVVLLLLFPLVAKEYHLYILSVVAIYAIAVLGLNIFFGYCGQVHFGMAAPYAIGAYSYALLRRYAELHFGLAFPAAILIAVVLMYIVSLPLLRLRSHAIALGTIALALTIFSLLKTVAVPVLGGDDGLRIPALQLGGENAGATFYYYLALGCAGLAYLVSHLVGRSRVGRAMRAIREEETAARTLGIDIQKYIRLGFLLSGAFAAAAGALYAQENGWISPENVSLWLNVSLVIMLIIGGLGSNLGAIVGALILTLLPDLFFGLQEYVFLVQALMLFVILRFLPKGIVGTLETALSKK